MNRQYKCIECGSTFVGYHYVHCIALRTKPAMTLGDWLGIGILIAVGMIVLAQNV